MPRAIHATYSNPGSKHACCTTGDPARRVQNKDIPAHCKAKEEQAAREQVAIRGTEERAKQTESQSGKHRQQPAQGAYSLHKPMAISMCEAQHSGMLSMRSMSIGRQTALRASLDSEYFTSHCPHSTKSIAQLGYASLLSLGSQG